MNNVKEKAVSAPGSKTGGVFERLNIPGILIGDIALFVFFSVVTGKFLSPYNLMLIARNCCTLLLTSTGLTLVILMGKNDVSVGSTVSMSAVVVALLCQAGVPTPLVILIPLVMGLAIGAFNGVLVAKLKFDYWVVAFSSMSIFAGLALVLTDGVTVPIKNPVLDYIGNGKIAGIYVIIWITVILVGLMVLIQKKTRFGYDVYSIGGSENVATVSGIQVARTRILVYAISGLFAAIAGVAIACMTNSGSPSVGIDYSFNAMAVVVIGGTSMAGGYGSMLGTIIGVFIMGILKNGLMTIGIQQQWQVLFTGGAVLLAVLLDIYRTKRVQKGRKKG